MIYPIVAYGDPVLKKVAREIPNDGSIDLAKLAADMFETMHHANGIGLAAPQIGLDLRIFVVDGSDTDDEEIEHFRKVFVNPQILQEEGELWAFQEGCLSIPGIREDVRRKARLRIRYFDEQWQPHEEEYDGMKARVIQHEYDHIEGKLFVDYLSPLKKRLIKGKLTDISKGKVKADYRMRFPA